MEIVMNTVKELRNATKMSRNKFAEYLGIPVSNIKNWENEIHNPPAYVIALITRVMEKDGYITKNLSLEQIDAIRQTRATLALENLKLSDTANENLQKMARGEMSREEYQNDLKNRYVNHELY